MTLPDINKTTFVAFTDISGFKMLSSNQKRQNELWRNFIVKDLIYSKNMIA